VAEEAPEKAMMLKKIHQLRSEENDAGREIYYPNQAITANEVVAAIRLDDIVFQMVLATCQAGKTGCMLATIEKLLQSDSIVNPDNIFVITGLSDTEWVMQTKKRLPFIGNNVIHRGQFTNSTSVLKNINNAVILVDECQIACKKDMSIDKLLEQAGLKDLAYLKDNNVNIVEFSATPNSTLNDIELWDTSTKTHIMKPGAGYKGHLSLIDNNRLQQSEDLYITNDPEAGRSCDYDDALNLAIKPAIDAIKDVKCKIEMCYTRPRFHIIRTPTGGKAETVIGRFKTIFGEDYAYKRCFKGEDKLMDELNKLPLKHTFLFIMEKARCAVTFAHKNLIGILYERLPKTPKDDVIVQGLAGRACGYNVDDGIIVFTNVPSIERYVTMVDSDFKERDGFTFTGDKSKKNTHLHPTTYKNTHGAASIPEETPQEPTIEKFTYFAQAKEYIKTASYLHKKDNANGPSVKSWEKKKDPNGFYKSTSGKAHDKTRIRSTDEIYDIRNWCLNDKHPYTFHPCYTNVEDKNTLQWWVIHR